MNYEELLTLLDEIRDYQNKVAAEFASFMVMRKDEEMARAAMGHLNEAADAAETVARRLRMLQGRLMP